jgi:hypothetical protein
MSHLPSVCKLIWLKAFNGAILFTGTLYNGRVNDDHNEIEAFVKVARDCYMAKCTRSRIRN